jgi:hypothetical protein
VLKLEKAGLHCFRRRGSLGCYSSIHILKLALQLLHKLPEPPLLGPIPLVQAGKSGCQVSGGGSMVVDVLFQVLQGLSSPSMVVELQGSWPIRVASRRGGSR